ncbi:MAG: anaerobic ribonucleoside-triphosphate reductase activating protein [Candidatus Delongbacteria bacterium]|nr:anaerobic ribonucleoside-triphosphate reductase activating protein [Candidatus Delongbacteria bacterium]MBN2836328.1 anaerobic ribonucleoside-triphosphate reductase activating protein [Candidatus Delongbacteria bacterium]
MKIAGFIPCSLNNYPDHLSFVIFSEGCNLKCPFCHNGHLIIENNLNKDILSFEEFLSVLKSRKKIIDGIVFSGGEPLLWNDLIIWVEAAKSFGYSVKLDTNGTFPEKLDALIKSDLLDYIAMDIKAPMSKYNLLAGVNIDFKCILKSMDLISQSSIMHEFRTTWIKKLLSVNDIKKIIEIVPYKSSYYLQKFVFNENVIDQSIVKSNTEILLEEIKLITNHSISLDKKIMLRF